MTVSITFTAHSWPQSSCSPSQHHTHTHTHTHHTTHSRSWLLMFPIHPELHAVDAVPAAITAVESRLARPLNKQMPAVCRQHTFSARLMFLAIITTNTSMQLPYIYLCSWVSIYRKWIPWVNRLENWWKYMIVIVVCCNGVVYRGHSSASTILHTAMQTVRLRTLHTRMSKQYGRYV